MTSRKYYICVTPFFPSPGNWRGAYVLDQVKAIQRNSDYEVVVFMGGASECSDYEIEGIRVFRYKTREFPSNLFNGFFNGYNSRSFVKRVIGIGIKPEDVVFVHCHVSMRAACGLALKKLNPNIKVLLQHHDLDPFNLRSGVIGRYNRINIRYKVKKALKLYNHVDLHICISEACKNSLLSFPEARSGECFEDYIKVISKAKGMPRVCAKDTYVLYNGVDTNLFKPNTSQSGGVSHLKRQDAIIQNKVFRIGCIANFQELKGHITLLKSFDRIVSSGFKNVSLSLLGSGETKVICEEYIKTHSLEDHIEWVNEVSHENLPDFYRSLDLFVLPSFFEGFGCVYTEAAACGVPYMGCYNQGYSEYIPDEEKDRWLIPPHDEEQLANLIVKQYKENANQVLCHTFNIDELIKEFLNYLYCNYRC